MRVVNKYSEVIISEGLFYYLLESKKCIVVGEVFPYEGAMF